MFPWTRNYIYLYILHKLILTLQFIVWCRLSITIDYELLSELKKKSFDKRILIYIYSYMLVLFVFQASDTAEATNTWINQIQSLAPSR